MKKLLAACATTLALASPALGAGDANQRALTLAVIGDTPYTSAQVTAFPGLIGDVNADRQVRRVIHVGDIKSGSSRCDTSYFTQVRGLLDMFDDPVVYTPGDNEWTDCHRPGAGSFLPTERLAALRDVFFDRPGVTLGADAEDVDTQAGDPRHADYVENQRWVERDVVFAALHVVGSNDDLLPWFGGAGQMPETSAQRDERLAERAARLAANLDWLDETFALAAKRNSKAVVLAMQADMWDAFSVANNLPLDGFNPIVERIATLSRAFDRPVLLLQGDSHEFLVDRPLVNGSPVHGVTTAAPNVTRVVVQGAQASEWLKVTIDRTAAEPFGFERIPVGS
jgi:hypothetical protein